MSQSANDWASLDPSQNITMEEADHLRDELAAGLCMQLVARRVHTQFGEIISEAELRQNQYMLPLAVNLYGYLAVGGSQEFNIGQFRAKLRDLAGSADPLGNLVVLLQGILPASFNIDAMFTRIPAVQAVVARALKSV